MATTTIDLSTLNGTNGLRLDGGAYDSGWSVSNAGDVNGDGFDDLIVGAPYTGSSYVVSGKASGFDATLDLSTLDNDDGIILNGVSASPRLSVSNAGDVNDDGLDDVIVGAPYEASSYVVFGRSDFTDSNLIEGTPQNDTLRGDSGADIFEAGESNDTLIGRGGVDVFHGDTGNDDIKVADLNFDLIDSDTGSDVLHLDGSNLNLDLSILEDKINGIKTICVYRRGDNTLTLTAEDLVNLSDTTDTLKVHGNVGDQIILDNEWADQGSHGFYHTYSHDNEVLLVGQNMTAEFV